MNPGAVLVFLLAGPATNFLAMSFIKKMIGLKGLVIYLITIVFFSFSFGLILDFLIPKSYLAFQTNPIFYHLQQSNMVQLTGFGQNSFGNIYSTYEWVKLYFAIGTLFLIFYHLRNKILNPLKKYILRPLTGLISKN